MFTPSKYQKTVYLYMQRGKKNIVVDAVAGSGKSTTIVNALKLIPKNKSVLFLAFNKSIVDELKRKVGDMPNVEISTLHSLGVRALRKGNPKMKINGSKCTQYINERMDDGTIKSDVYDKLTPLEKITWKKNILNLAELSRVNLLDTTDKKQLQELALKHDLDIIDNEFDVVNQVVLWDKNNVEEIDFCDMIYLPIVLNVKMYQYDWVFIDECQDLNAAQRSLFLKCVKPTGRWCAVGDEKQAIYGFAGADADSFKKLRDLPNTVKLPLSICYRCDESILTLAKTIVPQIQWREGAPMGEVNHDAKMEDVRDGDMILCRLTAPLVKLCMRYISEGKKAYVKGRDVGANLCRMIEQTDEQEIEFALAAMRRELGKIIGKLVGTKICANQQEAEEHPKYVNYKDKVDSIESISQGIEKSSKVIEKIKSIFSDDNGDGICLSSVHKSKGLENDRVFIICEDKLPLKGCMNIPWMAEQEWNLVYVAITRAKHYLGYIQDFM